MKLTEREITMLKAANHVAPRRLSFVNPHNQDTACRMDGMGLLRCYTRGDSNDELYVEITAAGRAALDPKP